MAERSQSETSGQPAWRDEHPSRFGGIRDGDYGPFAVGDHVHFVQFGRDYRDWEKIGFGRGYICMPGERTACGVAVPRDWKQHPEAHPIAGIVDCEACLRAMEAAKCLTPSTEGAVSDG